MKAITEAIEAGLFSPDWTWGHEFMIYIQTATVAATIQTEVVRMRFSKVHFEPLQTERAKRVGQPIRPSVLSPLR